MPELTDIWNNNAFRPVEITEQITEITYRPTLLGRLGQDLFPVIRSRYRMIAIIRLATVNKLVPVSPIGAPPVELEKAGGRAMPFFTRRLAKGSTVYAEELQGVLQLPLYQAVQTVQAEISQRTAMILDDIELTHEHMRLGAIQGKTIDADGTSVLDDWFAQMGVIEAPAIAFHLDDPDTNLRALIDAMITSVFMASAGAWIQGQTRMHAIVGDDFFTMLMNHPRFTETYLNTPAARELLSMYPDDLDAFGVVWHRFRGSADGVFAIPTAEARFFPVGAGRDVFQKVLGPAEFDPFINQPGRDIYALTIPDRDRNAWMRTECYNYPLYVCLRPEMLRKGVATA